MQDVPLRFLDKLDQLQDEVGYFLRDKKRICFFPLRVKITVPERSEFGAASRNNRLINMEWNALAITFENPQDLLRLSSQAISMTLNVWPPCHTMGNLHLHKHLSKPDLFLKKKIAREVKGTRGSGSKSTTTKSAGKFGTFPPLDGRLLQITDWFSD
ncbi:hypothetical protein Tco_0027180 [Tanacetum coccineum]